jgi:hypothetical protein
MTISPPPSPSPSPSTVQGTLSDIAHYLPSWLGPVSPFLVAFVAWLFAPQTVIGGLRWFINQLRKRRARGDKRRAAQRARFASAMAAQVARVSELEEWRDERFAEMDAEVEVHGRQPRGLLRRRRRETIRRVPSLSVALEESPDPIILLEGEPGSGKSVALRHVALRLATEVKEHPSEQGVIPLYLNLKEFRPAGAVDANAVLAFVRASINRANDRYVESFLEQEFDRGIEEGTWLFLFDSFDEAPAILGAVEADDVVEEYSNALFDFLTGMNACRGIIATREFRGPKRISWPRFRVLRLTSAQRRDLIDKLELPRDVEQRILGGLESADVGVRQLADNPLFLALLCEYQRDMKEFPHTSHVVFENYVAKRFEDDSKRLVNRFGLTAQTVRTVAEQAAYCMAAQAGLGLSPTRTALVESMRQSGFRLGSSTAAALDGLEYIRLARASESADGQANGFTFAHRRFQEYFATCLVMRESSRADPVSLLTDGRWRETAVTLFQTQSEAAIQPLLSQATQLLTGMVASFDGFRENNTETDDSAADTSRSPDSEAVTGFIWPPGSLHLLGLLQDGIPSGDHRRPADLGLLTGRLLKVAYSRGQLHDRRWAVEVCLAADPDTARDIVRQAFASPSGWLREAAYAQAGRLDEIPDDVRQEIRSVLAQLSAGGRLRQQRLAVDAQLRRLPDPRPELLLERLFLITPLADALLWAALVFALTIVFGLTPYASGLIAVAALIGHIMLYVDRDARRLDWEARYSGGLAWLYAGLESFTGGVRPKFMQFMALLVRLYASAAVLLAGLKTLTSRPLSFALAVVACAFVASWGVAANRADIILKEPSIPKILILPVLWVSGRASQAVESIDRDKILTGSGVVLFLALIGTGIGFLIAYGGTWALILFGIVYAFGFGFMLYSACRNLGRRWHDRGLLRKTEQDTIRYNSFSGMLDVLLLFRTNRALLLFVQDVKRRRVPAQYPASLRALRVFAATDQGMDVLRTLMDLEPSEIEEAERREDEIRNKRRELRVNQGVIDEIGKMVAEAEYVRLETFAPAMISHSELAKTTSLESNTEDGVSTTPKSTPQDSDHDDTGEPSTA